MAKAFPMVLTAVLALAGTALAASELDVRRESTKRRPDIVEIGQPYSISMTTVQNEAGRIHQMRTYLEEYGYPDYAEIQEIEPRWPWESYEVRLYYMRRNLELDFGHVFLSEAEPGFGVLKFQSYIGSEKRHEIEVVLASRESIPPPQPVAEADGEADAGGLSEALVARIEAAAERASQAADRAAEASEAAKRAADRTVQLVDQMIESDTE